MKTIISLVAMLCAFTSALAITTPTKVGTFYNGIEQLENTSDYNTSNTIQQRMAACFYASENSGINLSMDGLGDMSSTLYTMHLHSMLFDEKTLRARCEIKVTELAAQPDMNKGMEKKGANFYVTHVTKYYTQNGVTKTYNDIVTTQISSGLITEMANETDIDRSTVVPKGLTIEQLRSRAAYCYSKGKYTQAYDYYEQLIQKAPTDGDAAYRLALLTFWRKGCKDKFRSKKAAEAKAREYLNLASRYGTGDIPFKAGNVRDNWDHHNVYF